MKTYEEAVLILADLKQSPSFRYVCTGAFELLARMYDSDTVYDDVQKIIDEREAQEKIERKQRQREENEARRLANLTKSA